MPVLTTGDSSAVGGQHRGQFLSAVVSAQEIFLLALNRHEPSSNTRQPSLRTRAHRQYAGYAECSHHPRLHTGLDDHHTFEPLRRINVRHNTTPIPVPNYHALRSSLPSLVAMSRHRRHICRRQYRRATFQPSASQKSSHCQRQHATYCSSIADICYEAPIGDVHQYQPARYCFRKSQCLLVRMGCRLKPVVVLSSVGIVPDQVYFRTSISADKETVIELPVC